MISNKNLINEFLCGRIAQNGSMRSNGSKLFSYATCIAQRTPKAMLVNASKYSTTTSKQQTYLRRALEDARISYTEVGKEDHIFRGTEDLQRFAAA